eukprot:SAG31_NODE_281_length_18584_cov_10.762564_5_plen_100_part_00
MHKQEPRTSVDGDEATSGSLRKQQAAIYYCDHRKGQILLHGDGIYRLRDKIMSNPELKAEFNQILHGKYLLFTHFVVIISFKLVTAVKRLGNSAAIRRC